MNCSLGRTSGCNPYTNYRFLKGGISLSKNYHALELFSESIGAFLRSAEQPHWFHGSLPEASNWLKDNNPIFKQYEINTIQNNDSSPETALIPLPLARPTITDHYQISSNYIRTNSTIPDLVVLNDEFPPETHNEDYRYHRLMAGFMKVDDVTLPITYGDPSRS